jgi:hypothetical protein
MFMTRTNQSAADWLAAAGGPAAAQADGQTDAGIAGGWTADEADGAACGRPASTQKAAGLGNAFHSSSDKTTCHFVLASMASSTLVSL